MTRQELTAWNVGENLDQIMNLDPRGYGVCRILYEGSRAYTGKPLTINGAERLIEKVKEKNLVYIITGFVLTPFMQAETDGAIGAVLLAKALICALDAKPVIVCPREAGEAIINCAETTGLYCFENVDKVMEKDFSMGIIAFTKEKEEAQEQAEDMIKCYGLPAAVIAIEAPGANEKGEYHNATGLNVTALEAKSDVLFRMLCKQGVMSLAIGDLGNEMGMGTIGEHIRKKIPYTDKEECRCGCKGGILASSEAEHIITATTSDWGCYGLIGALAYLKKDMGIMQTPELEEKIIKAACKSGLIDMNGPGIQGIDGFDVEMNVNVVRLMRSCLEYAIRYEGTGEHWFHGVIKKNDNHNVSIAGNILTARSEKEGNMNIK